MVEIMSFNINVNPPMVKKNEQPLMTVAVRRRGQDLRCGGGEGVEVDGGGWKVDANWRSFRPKG